MLDLRPNCECCDTDLPPEADALICTFECTWCPECAEYCLGGFCPNCNGSLGPRPIRPPRALARHPASTTRVNGEHGHREALHPIRCPGCGGTRRTLARYPRALCEDCVATATSLAGEPVTFSNVNINGGFVVEHRDGQMLQDQAAPRHVVRIGDLLCWADEARYGGIVVEPYDRHHPHWRE